MSAQPRLFEIARSEALRHHAGAMTEMDRYEVLLPLKFNDGRAVPHELLAQTRAELKERFGAISAESQVIRGEDEETGSHGDQLIRVFVDVAATEENRHFFENLKERLKERFAQFEIFITVHPVRRL
jgi:hypothetical protein